ncbi:glycoside hydrolase domain-containing protein [Paractinoplanes toevensis]|uniref:Rv2525c-like glycoside hydrolase-like domain-containing protein n=1 Tax=Paractinoplanes toevensis TaxID=571911 RepID=A0A919T9K0_9ACTN|nr:glycoside hydrolase domain-containing protein [Actinoplanes toevensis]GIM91598.1 hypothetical protein Ato02nite_033910 [Actinoplanes toevensis]
MTVTIRPRSTWAAYVPRHRRGHAAAPPRPSLNAWDPVGGVFLHHRGPADAAATNYSSETDCLRDIAAIYAEDVTGPCGDISFNFLVCRHGLVYQGRGYERGEANGDGAIDTIDRNGGFYAIAALMRANHTAGELMLRSLRDLVQHLRDEAPRRTGTRILPHSFGATTDCPGNLLVYAQPGSTIDPAAAWSGTADLNVFAAQRWVNATYASAPGYLRCLEDGRTGWQTVLSLTQGLQFELGITPTVQNFGPGTFTAVKNRNTLPAAELNPNLVRIVNAGLWCKGYPAGTDNVWTAESQSSLERLFRDAGVDYGNPGWPHICKGLLRMDQFRLVPGGDLTVQRVQQRLNNRYVVSLGIPAMTLVPCDGRTSRDLQNGLLMAVQYEVGIPLASINGYFGTGTQAGLKAKGSVVPLPADLRYLFRAACYLNSPVPPDVSYLGADLDTDQQTDTHLAWLRAFQQFTQIPVTATNDFTTWAELLVSSGDPARPATASDGITEITAARGQALFAAGYRLVGRYLDEHLPPTDPYYLGKALKPGEPQAILDAGLRLFPIFQYNGTVLANFTYDKGYDQGTIAHAKSVEHGLPAGTCIYFAVDYDALDADVDSSIKPYFEGVKAALAAAGNRYTFGVYGSRNVCTRVSREVGATWSMVAAMSWGYSGNLGVRMPENWSLNQIREYAFQTGWSLDHDVWRDGSDPGVSTLDPIQEA